MKTSTKTKITVTKELEQQAYEYLKQVKLKDQKVNSLAYGLYLLIGIDQDLSYQEFKRIFGSALFFAIFLFPAIATYCNVMLDISNSINFIIALRGAI